MHVRIKRRKEQYPNSQTMAASRIYGELMAHIVGYEYSLAHMDDTAFMPQFIWPAVFNRIISKELYSHCKNARINSDESRWYVLILTQFYQDIYVGR